MILDSNNICRILFLIVVFIIISENLKQINGESKEDKSTRTYINETYSVKPKIIEKRYLNNTKTKFKNMIHKVKLRLHKTTKVPYYMQLKRSIVEEKKVTKTSLTEQKLETNGLTKLKKNTYDRKKRFFTNLGEDYKYQSGDENKNESKQQLMNVSKIHTDNLLGKYAKLFSTTTECPLAANAVSKDLGRQLMTRSINVTGLDTKAFVPLLEEIAGRIRGRDGVGALMFTVNSANGLYNIIMPAVKGETKVLELPTSRPCAGESDRTDSVASNKEDSKVWKKETTSDEIKALEEKARQYYGYLSFKVDQLLTEYLTNNNQL